MLTEARLDDDVQDTTCIVMNGRVALHIMETSVLLNFELSTSRTTPIVALPIHYGFKFHPMFDPQYNNAILLFIVIPIANNICILRKRIYTKYIHNSIVFCAM